MKICFLVGSVAISGGTYVILQHAAYLRRQGHEVTLAVQEAFTRATLSWHDEAEGIQCVPFSDGKSRRYHVVIATWWETALEIGEFMADHYGYFVQSIESRFYPASAKPLRQLVDRTYGLPVCYCTEATWIQSHLRDNYGGHASLIRNGIRKDIYSFDGPAICRRNPSRQPRVLIEGHFGVPFKNTVPAIQVAKKAGARDTWILTGSDVRWIPGAGRVFSRVPITHTPAIYRSCDVLVKLSTVEGMFGPPLEMFHCGGTAVVFDVTGHEEYIAHNVNSLVAVMGDVARVVAHLRSLLQDRHLLARLQEGALSTAAAWPSWEASSFQFQQWIEETLVSTQTNVSEVRCLVARAWEEYATAKESRLTQSTLKSLGYRATALLRYLPASARRILRQARIACTVVASHTQIQ